MKTKKAYLMILMSALSVLNAYSQLPSYVPSNGLVGYWPFNGNANDESGNGNNGIVNGATLTADRNGLANKAYSFDGISNCIDFSSAVFTNDNTFTISIWMKRLTSTINPHFPTIGIGYNGLPGNTHELNFGILGNDKITLNVPGYMAINGDQNVSIFDQWINLVVVKKSIGLSISVFDFYVNNIKSVSITTSGTNTNVFPLINKMVIGKQRGTGAISYAKGQIDEIAIFSRALTEQEITDLYNSQNCSNPTSTITPQGNTTFCQGGSVNLNASIGANYTYEWYNNGIIINNATSSIYNVATSGDYTVKVTDGACNATSSTQTVTVNANPSVSLNTLNNVVFKTSLPIQLVGNPSGGIYIGDAISGNIFTPLNATLGKKTISYNYTTQQGCSGSASQTTIVTDSVGNVCGTYDTLKIKVKFTAGLYTNTINTIKFYPNPTKDVLFIDNGNYQAMSGYSIKIVSLAGTVIYNQPITSQQVQISMNQFATKGLYIAQIVDSNNAIVDSKKIVLE